MKSAASRKIHYAPAHWLLGNAREMVRAPYEFLPALCETHGGLAGFRVLNRRYVATTNKEYTRHWLVTRHERYQRSFAMRNGALILGPGLLTSDGDDWLKHRRMLLPSFRPDHLHPLVGAVQAAVETLMARWDKQHRHGRPVEINTEMRRLSLDVISRMVLSESMPAKIVDWFSDLVTRGLRLNFKRNYYPLPLPIGLPLPDHRRIRRIRLEIDNFVQEKIETRRYNPHEESQDLLDAILHARDAQSGEALSAAQVLAEVKTLFVAGFETAATALTWALYSLARHPTEAQRWQVELDSVLGARAPALDDLKKLPYLYQIVHETLRLYPPVFNAVRECAEDDEMDGYFLPKGTLCVISIYGLHHSTHYWAEPERFIPARFALESSWDKDAFMPFLVGKHQCIGRHFAILEISLALAMIGQRYQIELVDERPVGMRPQITLVPERSILLNVTER